MSASLVGSEMCIRDRDMGVPKTTFARKGLLAASVGGAPPGASGASGLTAVSYTHLTLPTICSV
eukprot:13153976-Alexandrium_andersonii.AAC.1